jgi:hypothetical protein
MGYFFGFLEILIEFFRLSNLIEYFLFLILISVLKTLVSIIFFFSYHVMSPFEQKHTYMIAIKINKI